MNVYVATIIMLLFNAVAATAGSLPAPEEHANSQSDATDHCNAVKTASLEIIATAQCHLVGMETAFAELVLNEPQFPYGMPTVKGSWGEGDKLEHIEGAP